jgi:carotenoid 1,2-hydratase
MNRQEGEQHRAWLIDKSNSRVLEAFDQIDLVDKGLTFFGLHSARKIGLRSDRTEVQIQLRQLLDNGPFYQRFQSDAFLRIDDAGVVESKSGISEYIRPDRIFARIFWPFVDMRIQYKSEKPHWVQKSKRLYRWTW